MADALVVPFIGRSGRSDHEWAVGSSRRGSASSRRSGLVVRTESPGYTPEFFADLDRQLGDERGQAGEPSRGDFQTHDLLAIVERFATGWDDLPHLVPGREDYRVLISVGVLVATVSVDAQLASDGAVELVRMRIDLTWPDTDPDVQ